MSDAKYCEQDLDCVVNGNNCSATNKYNFKKSSGQCEWITYGAFCQNNQCKLETSPTLTEETARLLVIKEWGSCADQDCSTVSVVVEQIDKQWQITATYEGLRDDSLNSSRHTAPAYYQNQQWSIGEKVTTWKCQKNRGHQDFSTELCT